MKLSGRRLPLVIRGVTLCGALLVAGPVSVAPHPPDSARLIAGEGEIEETLSRLVGDIERARIDRALLRVEALIEARPNFALAQLIKGDLLMAHAHALPSLGAVGEARSAAAQDLRDEARARIQAYRDQPPGHLLPRALVQMGAHQEHAIVVDAAASRLYVFANENGKPRLRASFYASQGKAGSEKNRAGDKRTPLGVYRITERLPKNILTDFYGRGAFALDYPNVWDRLNRRSGSGIWLHGTPADTYSRPPRASEGCVVLSNADLQKLEAVIDPGNTPVVIVPHIEWVSTKTWNAEREALLAEIEAWRAARETLEPAQYVRHYADRMFTWPRRREAWLREEESRVAGLGRLQLKLYDLTILRDPKEELFVATFEQDATSVAGVVRSRVKQVWLREAGHWKILHEGGLNDSAPDTLSKLNPRSQSNEKILRPRGRPFDAGAQQRGAGGQPDRVDENQSGHGADRALPAAGAEVSG